MCITMFSGEIAREDVWQWTREKRCHRTSMRGGKDPDGSHHRMHGQEEMSGPMHLKRRRRAVGQPVQDVVNTDVCRIERNQ